MTMKRTKLARAILLVVAAVTLTMTVSGCILLPFPFWGGGGGGGHEHHEEHHDDRR